MREDIKVGLVSFVYDFISGISLISGVAIFMFMIDLEKMKI